MEKMAFAEILDRLDGLDKWLLRIGVRPKNDRVHRVIEIVRDVNEKWEESVKRRSDLAPSDYSDWRFGLIEAIEFSDIFKAFEHELPEKIGPKIKRALEGPASLAEENTQNTTGRNTMFELALAAEWRLRGLKVDIGEPDLTLDLDGTCFLIECKRPFWEHSIGANVRGAGSQLRDKLESSVEAVGIIAVSASRIVNPGTKVFWTPDEEGFYRLGDKAKRMMSENQQHWRKGKLHDRIAAVLFHTLTPGIVGDQQVLCRMGYSTLMEVDGSRGFQLLKGAFSPLYPGV